MSGDPGDAKPPGCLRQHEGRNESNAINLGSLPQPSISSCQDVDPIPGLILILGSPVVFIRWPKGSKGKKQKWKHLTPADMTPEYLETLPTGNIGVALGEVSGGLCAIDIDDDEFVDQFLALNPHIRDTLQTHGARGRVFWIRFKGRYPNQSKKLKTQSGRDIGEFRCNGNQSIVWGVHPNGNPYTYEVGQPVLEIDFNSLNWPSEISTRFNLGEEEPAHGHKSSSDSSVSSVSSPIKNNSSVSSVHHSEWVFTVDSVEDAIRRSLPVAIHQNNQCLFLLARGIKSVEEQHGKLSQSNLREAFETWHTRSKLFLDPAQTKENYYLEFLKAYDRAKFPLGGVILSDAWKSACEKEPPPEALQFENPELRLLIALCRELQVVNGNDPFFLSTPVCQKLFGHKNRSTLWKWLSALCGVGILQLVERGNSHRANRYRYLHLTPEEEGV